MTGSSVDRDQCRGCREANKKSSSSQATTNKSSQHFSERDRRSLE